MSYHSDEFEAWLVGDLGMSSTRLDREVDVETRSNQCYACMDSPNQDAYFSDGFEFTLKNPTQERSIIAHEYMHAVSHTYNSLDQDFDADALNEGYSDFFAVADRHANTGVTSNRLGAYVGLGSGRTVDNDYQLSEFENGKDLTGGGYSEHGIGGKCTPSARITKGPIKVREEETATWEASVSGGSGSYAISWDKKRESGDSWLGTCGTSLSCTTSFRDDNNQTNETGGIRLFVSDKETGATDVAERSVTIYDDDGGGGGCNAVSTHRICLSSSTAKAPEAGRLAGSTFQVEKQDETAVHLSWRASRTHLPRRFVVEHRSGTTGAWSGIGTVSAVDSAQSDRTTGPIYRFEAANLEVGTHQFRLALQPDGQAKDARLTSEAVTARIELEEAYRLRAYPNPVRERATIELALKERQDVRLAVYDVLGRQVGTVHDGPLPAQETERVSLNAFQLGLSSGTYFLRVQGEMFTATRRLTVVQ
jgi:hypothetical protein